MFWDWKLTADIWPLLLQASVVTVQATILGFAIAAVLGLLLAIGRMYGRPWLRVPLGGIVEFIRSTPLLIQIFFLYFVLPEFGVVLDAMTAGVLAIGSIMRPMRPKCTAPASPTSRAANGRRRPR